MTVIDDFESGSPSDDYALSNASATSFETGTPAHGSQHLRFSVNGGSALATASGLATGFEKGEELSVWTRASGGQAWLRFGLSADDYYRARVTIGDVVELYTVTGGSATYIDNDNQDLSSANTWYYWYVTWDDGTLGGSDNDITVELYEPTTVGTVDTDNDTQIAVVSGTNSDHATNDGLAWGGYSASADTIDYDYAVNESRTPAASPIVITDFEDTNVTDRLTGDTAYASFVTSPSPVNGSQSLQIDPGASFVTRDVFAPADENNPGFSKGEECSVWIRWTATGRPEVYFGVSSVNPATERYEIRPSRNTNKLDLYKRTSSGETFLAVGDISPSPATNEWYYVYITWDDGTLGGSDNDFTAELYNPTTVGTVDTDNDTVLASVSGNDSAYAGNSDLGFGGAAGNDDANDFLFDYARNHAQTRPAANSSLSATTASASSVDLSWTINASPVDSHRVEYSDDGGSTWTSFGSVGAAATSETVTGLSQDTTYTFRVFAVEGGIESDPSNTDTATTSSSIETITTSLPDAASPTVSGGDGGTLEVSVSDDTNYGDYRIQIREDGESTWTSSAAGFDETVVASDSDTTGTVEASYSGLTEGADYEARARTETEHVTGSWTTPVTGTVPLEAVTVTIVTAPAPNRLDVAWTKNDASSAGDYLVQYSTDGSTWSDGPTATLGETSASITGLAEETYYHVRVLRRANGAESASNVRQRYTKPAHPSDVSVVEATDANAYFVQWTDNATAAGYEVLVNSGSGFTRYGDDLPAGSTFAHVRGADASGGDVRVRATIGSGREEAGAYVDVSAPYALNSGYRLVVEPTDASPWQSTRIVEANASMENSALHGGNPVLPSRFVDTDLDVFGTVYLYVNDTLLIQGTPDDVSPDSPSEGRATLRFRKGVELEQDGPDEPVTFTGIDVPSAVEEYCEDHAGTDISVTVHTPPTTTKADDTKLTNPGFDGTDLYTPDADEPIDATSTEIANLRTSFTGVEDDYGGLYTVVSSAGTYADEYYIDGEAADLGADDNITYTFTPGYDIPSDRVGIKIHFADVDGSGSTSDFECDLSGSTLSEPTAQVGWRDLSSKYTGGDLDGGTAYTLTYGLASGTAITLRIDAVNVYDTDYPPTEWDSVPDGDLDGKIDAPENYPVDIPVALDPYIRTWSIDSARMETTWDNTENGQSVALSNDYGSTFPGETENGEDLTVDFRAADSWGVSLQPLITFSGHGSTTWLTDRAQGQSMTAFDVWATTSDMPIIGSDAVRLEGSDFDNLRRLIEDLWGANWVLDPTADGIEIEVFAPGDPAVERTLDSRVLEQPDPVRNRAGYANVAGVQYQDVDDDGETKTFETLDTDEQDRVGETVPSPLVPIGETDIDHARNRARVELAKRINNDELGGTIRAVADDVVPGYPYTVPGWPAGDGPYTLQRNAFSEAQNVAESSLQFDRDRGRTARIIETARATEALDRRTDPTGGYGKTGQGEAGYGE